VKRNGSVQMRKDGDSLGKTEYKKFFNKMGEGAPTTGKGRPRIECR